MRYWVSDSEDDIGRSLMADSAEQAVERALNNGSVAPNRHLWVRWDMRKTRAGAFLACRLLEIIPESALQSDDVVTAPSIAAEPVATAIDTGPPAVTPQVDAVNKPAVAPTGT